MQSFNKVTCFLFLLSLVFGSCHSAKHIASSPAKKPLSKNELREKYAAMMKIPEKSIKDYRLYHFIDHWYGVPYVYGGDDMKGIDCSGFAQKLYEHVYGLKIQRTVFLQYDNTRHRKKIRKLREGVLVFFKTKGEVTHVGVYLKNGYFVHASKSKGVMISSLHEDYWKKMFAGGGPVRSR